MTLNLESGVQWVWKNVGFMIFTQTVNVSCCVWFILTQFFRELTEEEVHSYFMQNGATAHTANISLATWEEVFSKQLPTLDNSQFAALYISRFESEWFEKWS